MRVLIMNGAVGPDPLLDDLTTRLTLDFEARDASVETSVLRHVPVAYCQGCFECWTHTPGLCKIEDAGRDLAREFVAADIVVLITPVRFGGYSWEGKKMLDRTLGMLLPFFRRIDGEVHHSPRYKYPPAFGVLAVVDAHDADLETTVRALVTRNAINFASPTHAVGVVGRTDGTSLMFGVCDSLAAALCAEPSADHQPIVDVDTLLPVIPLASDAAPPTRVLLLVGSAKPHGTSTSEALGLELLERLAMHGLDGDVRFVQRDAHSSTGLLELVGAVRTHELLIIATPIYIDAVPSLVTRAMEAIADDRRRNPAPAPLTVAMVLNCGFPEARHAAVARTIGALFARDAGARWAGALQLGGGGSIAGRPLTDVGHAGAHLAAALDTAAAALADGRAIPSSALTAFQEPLMPTTLYMAAGDAGWLWTAAHEGSITKLWQRPALSRRAPAAPESGGNARETA